MPTVANFQIGVKRTRYNLKKITPRDNSSIISVESNESQDKATIAPYQERFRIECVEGSAIDPDLYAANVRFIEDTGRWETYDALGFGVSRFWQRKPHDFGTLAGFYDELGELWQVKPEKPLTDKKGKLIKYLAPKGSGNQAYFGAVTVRTWLEIAKRYSLVEELPQWVKQAIANGSLADMSSPTKSFWEWVRRYSQIKVLITEGFKKAECLLSMGYAAIALYGCKNGNSTDLDPYLEGDRKIVVAFDQDSKIKARRAVDGGINILARRVGTERLKFISWSPEQGKGIDDLTVAIGAEAVGELIDGAISIEEYRLIQRLNRQLTIPASLHGNIPDLSTLKRDCIPQEGILAIVSGKGTGKSKFIAAAIKSTEKVISQGHRIALQRNLSERLGLVYQGDTGQTTGRSKRIGGVIDSVLGIELHEVEGGDLVLDETTQLLRHLLTSSTCNKDGKRPALLARFRELVRAARRVILADADLDNATIKYIKALRGEDRVFLIRNDYQNPGYQAKFINCKNSTAILGMLGETAQRLAEQWKSGGERKTLFIATDTKKACQDVAKFIEDLTGLPVLAIHSLTSGAEEQRAFIKNPNPILASRRYFAIVASPALGTGVSAEENDVIHSVWGLFGGYSINDGDMAQALMRVREPVPRYIWAAPVGRNFSKVSRSTNPDEIIAALKVGTAASLRILRSSLRQDVVGDIEALDFENDPHIKLWARISANQNHSMFHLRNALRIRLEHEGHSVEVVDYDADEELKAVFKSIRHDIEIIEATVIVTAIDITYQEMQELEVKEGATPEERAAVQKFKIKDFYCKEEITVDDVLLDRNGRRRAEIASLEQQLDRNIAIDRTVQAIDRNWAGYICPWDLSKIELQRAVREELGLNDFLTKPSWTPYDLAPYANKIRAAAADVKIALNATINDKMTDTQVVHSLLAQMGLRCESQWSRKVEGHEGKKVRVYSLRRDLLDAAMTIIDRRRAARLEREELAEIRESKPVQQDLEISEAALQDWVQVLEGITTVPGAIAGFIPELKNQFINKPKAKMALWASLKLQTRQLLQEAIA